MLRLGIVGLGFVGKAVSAAFDTDTVQQFVIDPAVNNNTMDGLANFHPHITFVCVPTPAAPDHTVDVSIVESVLDQFEDAECSGTLVLKSTITPDHLVRLRKRYWFPMVYNPEFLREAHAISDFINPAMQILGGNWYDCVTVEQAYNVHSTVKIVPTFKTDLVTASLLKYTINSWLATKVVFMNEIYHLHNSSGAESTWEQFIEMLQRDTRVGHSHLQVPGPDKNLGFGGHCFPKDTAAFSKYAENLGVPQHIVQKAREINNILRKSDPE